MIHISKYCDLTSIYTVTDKKRSTPIATLVHETLVEFQQVLHAKYSIILFLRSLLAVFPFMNPFVNQISFEIEGMQGSSSVKQSYLNRP
jgi:hypothetical protein